MATRTTPKEIQASLVPPPVAGIASLILPGLGQVLARQLQRGLILIGSTISIVGLLVWRVSLLATRQVGIIDKTGLNNPETKTPGRDRKPVLLALGAAAAALIIGTTALTLQTPKPGLAPLTYATAIGEQQSVTLDDGSVLTLGTAGVRVHVVTDRRGRVRGAVSPGDIIVSAEPFDSSARNVLRSRVTGLRERGGTVYVTAEVVKREDGSGEAGSSEAGKPVALTASVTPESCRRLGLTAGSEVVLTFKATAVRLF